MRLALVLVLVAACDLQPPKREAPKVSEPAAAPAAPADAATAQLPAQPPPVAVVLDAGAPVAVPVDAAAPAVEEVASLSKECTDVAVHIAEQVIKSVSDPAQKAALEQDRTKLVRRAGETCTRDKWSEAARKCFLAANSKDTLEACGKQLPAP